MATQNEDCHHADMKKVKTLPYQYGRYAIRDDYEHPDLLRDFILNKQYSKLEEDTSLYLHRHRKRNRLYTLTLPGQDRQLVMKLFRVSKDYRFLRRLNLYLTALVKDYCLVAYKGALLLERAGIPTARPLAWWTVKTSLFNRTSYFLYEKVAADWTLGAYAEQHDDAMLRSLREQALDMIQSMHAAGIRHGDPHAGNFLFDSKEQSASTPRLWLIDTDHVSQASIRLLAIKRFFDLKCLRRANIFPEGKDYLLRRYLGNEYSGMWGWALEFWMRGGFKINKWFCVSLLSKNMRGKHL